jgi:hypothetical protein
MLDSSENTPDFHPKTVQSFLTNGNAPGVRIAEITRRTVQAVQTPWKKLDDAAEREEVQWVGVYFVFGDVDDDASKPPVYIGEAANCYAADRQSPPAEGILDNRYDYDEVNSLRVIQRIPANACASKTDV